MTERMKRFINNKTRSNLDGMTLDELIGLGPYVHRNVGIHVLGPRIRELKKMQSSENGALTKADGKERNE